MSGLQALCSCFGVVGHRQRNQYGSPETPDNGFEARFNRVVKLDDLAVTVEIDRSVCPQLVGPISDVERKLISCFVLVTINFSIRSVLVR